jgi:hypothetical protein
MSRANYLKSLERINEALKKATDELTRENYELRLLLENAARTKQITSSPNSG